MRSLFQSTIEIQISFLSSPMQPSQHALSACHKLPPGSFLVAYVNRRDLKNNLDHHTMHETLPMSRSSPSIMLALTIIIDISPKNSSPCYSTTHRTMKEKSAARDALPTVILPPPPNSKQTSKSPSITYRSLLFFASFPFLSYLDKFITRCTPRRNSRPNLLSSLPLSSC